MKLTFGFLLNPHPIKSSLFSLSIMNPYKKQSMQRSRTIGAYTCKKKFEENE
jgi:hypothetical protein